MTDGSLESQVNQEYASNESEYDPRQPQSQSTLSKLGDAFREMYQNVKDLGSAVRDSSDDYSARRRGAVAGGLATAVGAGLLALGGCDGGPGTTPGNGQDTTDTKSDSIEYTATLEITSRNRGIPLEGVPVQYQAGDNPAAQDTTDSLGTVVTSGKVAEGDLMRYEGGGEDLFDITPKFETAATLEEGKNVFNYRGAEHTTAVRLTIDPRAPEGGNVKSHGKLIDEFPRVPPDSETPPADYVDTEEGVILSFVGTHYSGTKEYEVVISPLSDSLDDIYETIRLDLPVTAKDSIHVGQGPGPATVLYYERK